MIVFDLRCAAGGHVFEAWFGSTGDYETQRGRGLVQCPLCGDPEVEKAVMAPRLGAKGNQIALRDQSSAVTSDLDAAKRMMAAMAAAQRELLACSEHVGARFADEARAIHLGEAQARSIHGRATREQTESLLDDGIPVAPLPFPVVEPSQEN
ncbi:MAG TPA: DUF1178 family protein [Allosphingosinicella sp.]|jgi:hypothetical protein|uniref:DUF1178 family protein n=1 Tax=Allosphingosinicella sp. TaxID=2823234 RepID=UPI002F2859FB